MRLTKSESAVLDILDSIMGGKPGDWEEDSVQYLKRNGLADVLSNGRVCITDKGRRVNNENQH